MLKKENRLPGRAKLIRPSTVKTQFFTCMVSKNNLLVSRFGFIISKKIDPRAVVRNRTKRILRSCIEEMYGNIKIGYDMLFILRKAASGKERVVIHSDIENFLVRQQLIK